MSRHTKRPAEETNTSTLAPKAPSPKPRPQPATSKPVADRLRVLQQRMAVVEAMRPQWRRTNRDVKRLQRTLASNRMLRIAMRNRYDMRSIPFLLLTPRQQLKLVRQVNADLKKIAKHIVQQNPEQRLDPNDPTNPFNQSNPLNLANQTQAVDASVALTQDNEVMQNEEAMSNQQSTIENAEEVSHENSLIAGGIVAFTLTAAEEQAIADHNQQYQTPTPQPGATSEKEETEKETEHLAEEKGVKFAEKDERAFETALRGDMYGDKALFTKGAKGLEDHMVEKAVTAVVSTAAHAA